MQVKVIIGTAAFMLTMIVIGFAALLEPSRLEAFTFAREARQIENGAMLYADNCAGCHAYDGLAAAGAGEGCTHPDTGEVGVCIGKVLNGPTLLCNSPVTSASMQLAGWEGSKLDFVHNTINAGRPGLGMPTWGQQYGGPLQADGVEDVSRFVLNWETDEMCGNIAEPVEWPEDVAALLEATPGDAANGANLFNSYQCLSCHGDPTVPGSNNQGPWQGDIGATAGTRIDGYSAEEYLYESILDPNAFIAENCGNTPDGSCQRNVMPQNFPALMSEQDMADIITYLSELR